MFDPSRLSTVGMALLALLITMLALYLHMAGKRLADALNLKTFLEHKTTEILVFLCVGIVLRLFLTHINREDFYFLADAIVVASTIGLMVEVQHIRESHRLVNIAGTWLYQVKDSNGYITHGGVCTIQQERDGTLDINGERRYQQYCGEKVTCDCKEMRLDRIVNDGIYWKTHFAMIHGGENKKIDFVYTIRLGRREVNGYCHLTPTESKDGKPCTLKGDYTHLAPDVLLGSIVFTRMADSDEAETTINTIIREKSEVGKSC